MTVKRRSELAEWMREDLTIDNVRVPWVCSGMFWGPECPIDKSHGALIDLKGGGWFCRHQAHDTAGKRAVFDDDTLRRIAYERALEHMKTPSP